MHIQSARVYVVSVTDFLAGGDHGRWIDADQPAETIHAQIRAMLAESSQPGACEWEIHRAEGFGSWSPREREPLETVAAVASLVRQFGPVAADLLEEIAATPARARDLLIGSFLGRYASLGLFAQESAADRWGRDLASLPPFVLQAIDWEAAGEELERAGTVLTIRSADGVHVFCT